MSKKIIHLKDHESTIQVVFVISCSNCSIRYNFTKLKFKHSDVVAIAMLSL